MNRKAFMTLIILLAAAAVLVVGGVYWYLHRPVQQQATNQASTIATSTQKEFIASSSTSCLTTAETATWNNVSNQKIGSNNNQIAINIFDNISDTTSSFAINNVTSLTAGAVSIHACHVYVNRLINGCSAQLWRYDYTGNGQSMETFYDCTASDTLPNIAPTTWASASYVDPAENYLALSTTDQYGNTIQSVTIVDLKNMSDLFTVNVAQLASINNVHYLLSGLGWNGEILWVTFGSPANPGSNSSDAGHLEIDLLKQSATFVN